MSYEPYSRGFDDQWEKRKVVGVDFDETISDNPPAWLKVMASLEMSGYQVVVVTWRSPTTYPEDLQFLVDKGYKIYYTSFTAKRKYMLEQGVDVSIWIDDNPWAVENDAEVIWNMDHTRGVIEVETAQPIVKDEGENICPVTPK